MKKMIIALSLVPTLSFAALYNCSGAGFSIDVSGTPAEMRIVGNGFNTVTQNLKMTATFDTVFAANTTNPAASVRLTIKDSSFANPGDRFTSSVQVSSAQGVKDYAGLTCIRGNE